MNAENSDQRSLLARHRLWVVMGKGGTGRTTLAAALGVLAARVGLRALVVAPAGDDAMGALLGAEGSSRGERQPIAVASGLDLLRIDPRESLSEYLRLHVPFGRMGRALLQSPVFHGFLEAAPGWRDLVMLGQIWSLEQEREASGRPRYDVIFVDAPATGHGLSFLSIPRVVLDAVGAGPIRRHAEEIQRLLADRERTACLPVTLAEELPVRETTQLLARLRELAIGVGPLCVNRVEPEGAIELERLGPRLRELDARTAPPLAQPALLLEALEHGARRERVQQHWLRELSAPAGVVQLRVPYLVAPIEDPDGVARLADALAEAWVAAEAA